MDKRSHIMCSQDDFAKVCFSLVQITFPLSTPTFLTNNDEGRPTFQTGKNFSPPLNQPKNDGMITWDGRVIKHLHVSYTI